MNAVKANRVIDLHAHAVLEAAFNQAGRYGPQPGMEDGVPYFRIGDYRMKPMSYQGTVFTDVAKRLDLMDRLGIDVQLLSPNPLTMFHRIEADVAARFCRIHNDTMAELVARHPGKLLGAAALPMQDVDAAMRELERAVTELGLVAAHTGTHYPFPLDDARLDDFYRTLVALDVPLFLHPESTGGAAGPDDARLGRFDLTILLGYAYEETLAVATLVLGGVLDRHPHVDICVSHGGGAIPYLIDHFERMGQLRNWPALHGGTFRSAMSRLWFDAHTEGAAAHAMLVDTLGSERLVYGTNFGGWDTPRHVGEFAASLSANAERLLRLEPGTTRRSRPASAR